MLFALIVCAVGAVNAAAEDELRLRLGALPAMWKFEHDVQALQGYLETPASFLQVVKDPDCTCESGDGDCGCSNAKPVVKKSPDCDCEGGDGDCGCDFAKPAANDTAKVAANATVVVAKNETDAVDPETAQLLKNTKNLDVKDMPMMLGLLKAMYDRFKHNIGEANKLEVKTKASYEKNMLEYHEKEKANHTSNATKRMAEYWEKSRGLSHQHYHSMLKVAHAGMQRLQMAIDMMGKAIEGKQLDKGELNSLKQSLPPTPTVVFMQVRKTLLKYCHEALLEIADAKASKGPDCACINKNEGPDCACINKNEKKGPDCACINKNEGPDCACINSKPVNFLQVRATTAGEPAPEDQLAKEMTHDLEMNFNKIAPFGKEDTAKELQDHAAKTQDTLVDAVENAEVAEIKRAVFRALTRLRAATIKEFDTIARLETQAIDAYNDAHHYRAENPLSHLHEDEAPVETDKLKSFH